MKQYRNLVWECGNKYTNLWIHLTIILKIPKIHFFPKFCKMLGNFILFIDKAPLWWLLIKIVIKHPTFYISSCYNWGIKSKGVIPQYFKSHSFWNFTNVALGIIEEKKVVTSRFIKSYKIIVYTLSKRMITVKLHVWVKNVVFEQKEFHLLKLLIFYRNKGNGYRKQSLKSLSLIRSFFWILRVFKFKIQRHKTEWCKLFWWVYFNYASYQNLALYLHYRDYHFILQFIGVFVMYHALYKALSGD